MPDLSPKSLLNDRQYKIFMTTNVMHIGILWLRIADSEQNMDWNMKQHHHAFYELHFVLNGSCEIRSDNSIIPLPSGTYYLIPPRKKHSFYSVSSNYCEFVMGFYMDFPKDDPDALRLLQSISCLPQSQGSPYNSIMQDYVYDIVRSANETPFLPSEVALHALLLIHEFAKQAFPNQREREKSEDDLISEIKAYITGSIASGITANDVAKHVSVSLRHLNRLLAERLGNSVSAMIMDEKMNRICTLLNITNMTLDQIAELSGFTNAYNMSRSFKKNQGMSPGEYRKALRKK